MNDADGLPIVSFCTRERDLAPMTVVDDGTRLVARTRRLGDVAPEARRPGAFDDRWIHVRSGGRYVRRDDVFDLEDGAASYEYAAEIDGTPWLRAADVWHETVEGRPRFEPA